MIKIQHPSPVCRMRYLGGYGAARLATGVVALDKKALWSCVGVHMWSLNDLLFFLMHKNNCMGSRVTLLFPACLSRWFITWERGAIGSGDVAKHLTWQQCRAAHSLFISAMEWLLFNIFEKLLDFKKIRTKREFYPFKSQMDKQIKREQINWDGGSNFS